MRQGAEATRFIKQQVLSSRTSSSSSSSAANAIYELGQNGAWHVAVAVRTTVFNERGALLLLVSGCIHIKTSTSAPRVP